MIHLKDWKSSLIRYFAAGEKSTAEKRLGVELEHIIAERGTGKAVPYAGDHGIRTVLVCLMAQYPGAVMLPEEAFLGFRVPEFSITLEPAAQLEISIAPESSVRCIGEVYRDFISRLEPILSRFGHELYTVGCQPVSRVEDLTLIPKQRYAWMNDHFRTT